MRSGWRGAASRAGSGPSLSDRIVAPSQASTLIVTGNHHSQTGSGPEMVDHDSGINPFLKMGGEGVRLASTLLD